MKTLTIDTSEFTRRGDSAQGERPVPTLPRLASLLLDDRGAVRWRLSGRIADTPDGERHRLLGLSLDATVTMRCVRCLEPVDVPIAVQRDYRLVASETQAAREDAEDEAYDVLVGSRQFDVAELVEDEAIMALPFAPRHDDCRPPPGADDVAPEPQDDERAPNPFAVLQRLRRGDDDGSR